MRRTICILGVGIKLQTFCPLSTLIDTTHSHTSASASAKPGAAAARRSEKMLGELLALNEEMIVQLRLERISVVGTTEFLTEMITQHEQIVSRLGSQLKRHQAGPLEVRAASHVHPKSR